MPRPDDLHGKGFATRAVHGARVAESLPGRPVNVPIYQTANFEFDSADEYADVINEHRPGYVYTRLDNPTTAAFCHALALLEGGEAAWALASGMAAIHAAFAAQVSAGQHVVCTEAVYGGTHGLLTAVLPRFGVETTYVDIRDLSVVRAALRAQSRIIYAETICNPTLQVPDLAALAELAHQAGCLLLVDNTFATPYLCNPLGLGADLVIHSATKYLGGHADAIGGVVVGSAELVDAVRRLTIDVGGILGPLDAFLLIRGLKTLSLRVERACATALQLAQHLEGRPGVECVLYPGLPSHPQYELARQVLRAGGGVLGFEVAGSVEGGRRVLDALRLIRRAPSLGECHTLATHAASTTHRQYTREERERAGITDGFIRLAVGLEDPEDLLEDLEQALSA